MPADHPPHDLVASGSLPCIRCAYDLDRCSLDGVCPECGTPVARSRDSLWLEGVDFIQSLRRGLSLLTLASFIGPGVYAVILLWVVALRSPDWDPLPCFVVTSMAGPVLAWTGMYQFMGHPAAKRLWSTSLNPYAHVLSIAFAANFMGMVVILNMSMTASSPVREKWLTVVAMMAGLAWCARNLIILAHVRAIAQVSNMPRLAAVAPIFQIGAAVLGLIGGLCGAHYAGVLGIPNPLRNLMVTTLGLAMLGWFIAWPMLLQTTSRGLKRILAAHSRRGQPFITAIQRSPSVRTDEPPSTAPPTP